MQALPTTREQVCKMDVADPLAPMRARFQLPADLIYLDGNSLGPVVVGTGQHVSDLIERQWGEDLIGSWNSHDWFEYPSRVGDKLARLIGAKPGEVIATDSTSINLFKMAAAALKMRTDRHVIITQGGNFPTDIYITEGLAQLLDAGHEIRQVENQDIVGALSDEVAIVILTQVDYRTGERLDMTALTAACHAVGALVIWDLCHSAGAFEVDLHAANADFAVGCGYKYLNGGPGAPAFLFVATRHQDVARQPLSGWWGHRAPFDFENHYRAASGIKHHLCGTQPILSMAALDHALDLFDDVDMAMLRSKSVAMSELFIGLLERDCEDFEITLACPRQAENRGSQVSFRHQDGFAVMQALIDRNVIGDFRAPDILRFGLAPLYNRYVDIWDAVTQLRDILENETWQAASYQIRGAVT